MASSSRCIKSLMSYGYFGSYTVENIIVIHGLVLIGSVDGITFENIVYNSIYLLLWAYVELGVNAAGPICCRYVGCMYGNGPVDWVVFDLFSRHGGFVFEAFNGEEFKFGGICFFCVCVLLVFGLVICCMD